MSIHPPEEGRLGRFSGDGFVTSLKEAREHPPIHPPQDTPTAKNYLTQNVSSAEVEKRCSEYILNPARWSMLSTHCVLLCWGIV